MKGGKVQKGKETERGTSKKEKEGMRWSWKRRGPTENRKRY
jgi:hypothetical protein